MKTYIKIFLVTLMISSCSISHMHLKPVYQEVSKNKTELRKQRQEKIAQQTNPKSHVDRQREAQNKKFYISTCAIISDDRQYQSNGLTTIENTDILNWLAKAISAESMQAVKPVNTSQNHMLPKISAKKVYVKYEDYILSGIVVLAFEYAGKMDIFRGQATKMNWAGTESEHQSILNLSLQDAVIKLLDANFLQNKQYPQCADSDNLH